MIKLKKALFEMIEKVCNSYNLDCKLVENEEEFATFEINGYYYVFYYNYNGEHMQLRTMIASVHYQVEEKHELELLRLTNNFNTYESMYTLMVLPSDVEGLLDVCMKGIDILFTENIFEDSFNHDYVLSLIADNIGVFLQVVDKYYENYIQDIEELSY